MLIAGLSHYRLSATSLARLGRRAVTVDVKLKGVSLKKLIPLSPQQRNAQVRTTLKAQFESVDGRFPGASFRAEEDPRTLRGIVPARLIRSLASQPEVAWVWIREIAGRSKRRSPRAEKWFCVWGLVAIQVEGDRSPRIDVQDRLVLVRAFDFQDAVKRLRPYWKEYANPYLNPAGALVRWKLIEIVDVCSLLYDRITPSGTEVYSRLRTVKAKSSYRWKKSRTARR